VTLDRIDGDLKVGNNATIQASNGKKVFVTGNVFLEGKAYVNCDLECDSVQSGIFLSRVGEIRSSSNRARLELTGRYAGKLNVNGNLIVHKQLNVSHSVEVKDEIEATDIDVGGRIRAGAIKCTKIRVGGRADIQSSFQAQTVEVGGKVVASGTVKIGDLHVGGEIEVGGGSITGNIRVGGKFISKSPLEFGNLSVYGKGSLPANCKGHKISTFGKLEVAGNLSCDIIESGGVTEIRGDCHAQKVEVGGRFEVDGSLFVSDELEGYGEIEIDGDFQGSKIRFSGKLKVKKLLLEEEADLSGKLEAEEGLKAKLLIVRSGSRVEGVLVGERVEVGKSADLNYGGWGNFGARWAGVGGMASVNDVYATEVLIGPMSRAAHIFAATVELEQGSAAEQILYTTELKMDLGAASSEAPMKVETLPKPPF